MTRKFVIQNLENGGYWYVTRDNEGYIDVVEYATFFDTKKEALQRFDNNVIITIIEVYVPN